MNTAFDCDRNNRFLATVKCSNLQGSQFIPNFKWFFQKKVHVNTIYVNFFLIWHHNWFLKRWVIWPWQHYTWEPVITHPFSPPLPISHLGSSNYPPTFTNQFQFCTWTLPITPHTFTFTTTLNVTPGNIWLHIHFYHHLWFHTWAPPITAHRPDDFPFHTWAPPITHPISTSLPISHWGTSD